MSENNVFDASIENPILEVKLKSGGVGYLSIVLVGLDEMKRIKEFQKKEEAVKEDPVASINIAIEMIQMLTRNKDGSPLSVDDLKKLVGKNLPLVLLQQLSARIMDMTIGGRDDVQKKPPARRKGRSSR